jgi:TP901 family phage tail tape measure protein
MPLISTLWVNVESKTSGLITGLGLAGTAVVAVGALATKMALDYDDAFTRIAALSNASAKDIEKWKGEVLDLAGKTAQAPQELAEALYFLASAGLKSSQIMPVLTASAKASAVGLGETADIAKLTANVLNAYAGSGLQAAHVTDVLVSAVKQGSADADAFGTAIGRILPIASAAGISFDNVAASLAALSNVGIDVDEGVTAMRGLLQALVSPTEAAAGAMHHVGLTAQELLDSLQGEGLIATLEMLDQKVKAQTTTQAQYMHLMREIVPNVRALTGALGLTQQQAARVDAVFQKVSHSTGEADKAFKTTADSAGFKLKKSLVELEVMLVKLGQIILPLVVKAVKMVQQEWEAWSHMIESVGGAIARWWDKVKDTLGKMVNDVKGAFAAIKGVFMGAPDWFYDTGKAMILGLWNGLKSMFSTVWNGLTSWVSGLVDHVKSFLHIGSPSQVFEEIGKNVSLGFQKGVEGGGQSSMSAFGANLSLGAAGAIAPAGGITVVINGDVTGEEVVRKVRDGLLKLQRRNVTTGIA